jgi:hypothetical protein
MQALVIVIIVPAVIYFHSKFVYDVYEDDCYDYEAIDGGGGDSDRTFTEKVLVFMPIEVWTREHLHTV